MGLSQAINNLSLISKLILLESLDKMVELLKFMLQSACLPNAKFPSQLLNFGTMQISGCLITI